MATKGFKKTNKKGPHCWLAIVKSPQDLEIFLMDPWWCLPAEVAVGDGVLLYRPRSALRAKDRQLLGIFGASKVERVGASNLEERMRCAGSAVSGLSRTSLTYCRLGATVAFPRPLTPTQIRRDPILGHQSFVRKNFQGAAFAISRVAFEHSVALGTSIQHAKEGS